MDNKSGYNKISHNKTIGVILLILAVFGFLLFTHRLCYYVYEYDAQYSPIDWGKFNILSYFTVQSNFACYVWLLFASLSILGVKKAEIIGFNQTFAVLVTVYVIIAGITYCAGIPMGLTPPFKWDSPGHSISSFIQIYYHMIMPVVVLILLFFPFKNVKAGKKTILCSGIYPLVYSIFSMIRGKLTNPSYYPYPFYNTGFIIETFGSDKIKSERCQLIN